MQRVRFRAVWVGVIACVAASAMSCSPAVDEPVVEARSEQFYELTGDYLGQELPGLTPRLFAPGIVSTGLSERDMAITPDGDEIYFSGVIGANHNFSAILVVKRVEGWWSKPEVAPFSGHYMDLEPAISPDGQRLFFLSNRPLPGSSEPLGSEDIWVMERTEEGWGEPANLGPPVNSSAPEFFPSVTRDGTLYFTRRGEGRSETIFRSRFVDGAYSEPEELGPEVNSGQTQFNAFIAPDESYLIVCVWGRDDSLGGVDYYVVFRSPEDVWSEPINLGEGINMAEGGEWSPYVSPDGRYFFFMSSRATIQEKHSPERLDYADMQRLHDLPMNGNSDIWWVDAEVINRLRPESARGPVP
jgi:Tol biopolymer transport system component